MIITARRCAILLVLLLSACSSVQTTEPTYVRPSPEIPKGAFEEHRRERESHAEMNAIQARGEKLPSEVVSSMMGCLCGVQFDSWKPDESYDHRAHIYAAQAAVRPV